MGDHVNIRSNAVRFLPLAAALLLGCGQKPASLELTPRTLELGKKGESKSIAAVAKDKNGAPIEKAQFEWSSKDPKVATVDATGKVTAVSTGTTAVSVKAGEIADPVTVVVTVPEKVTIDPPEVVLRGAGASQDVTIAVIDDKKARIPGAQVVWTSDNAAVATAKGTTVTAIADGAAKLTATSGDATATLSVTVKGPVATTITIEPSPLVLKAGAQQQLVATVMDDSGQPMTGAMIAWTSADPGIASVDPNGMVNAMRKGDTTVTGATGAANGQIQVKVR